MVNNQQPSLYQNDENNQNENMLIFEKRVNNGE